MREKNDDGLLFLGSIATTSYYRLVYKLKSRHTMIPQRERRRRRRRRSSGSIFIFLIVQLFLLSCSTSEARRGQVDGETAWKEILPDTHNNDNCQDDKDSSTKRRPLFWCGNINDDMTSSSSSSSGNLFRWRRHNNNNNNNKQVAEHPLRTDLYQLNVSWMGFKERFQKSYPKTIQVEFHPNGFCRLYSDENIITSSNNAISDIGTWMVFPWGVWFNIHHDGFDYTFNAALHLNPFGKHPKLMQGTIIKSRNTRGHQDDEEQDQVFVKTSKAKWFRPVVGKFSGLGIGTDSIDLSYSSRR